MVSKQTVTLANSIVGVSVLAMPFYFKQCGIILPTLMLMLGAVITRTVCYFLLKAGTITRRRNYEMLAWHTFGVGGKFMVEISIIGFLFGTLIAFFVVMGDLGPEIVSEIFQVGNNYSLRTIIIAALCLFVALPLGLLRNIDSLSPVSTNSVLFYVFLVFKILSEGVGPLFSGDYLDKVDYWRPAGVLQSIPIFSMALSCQTQIFGIYESLPVPSLHKMNDIVKQAVIICTLFYFCVGFFGYIVFSHINFGGNILMTFTPSGSTQLIKICFLMSIVFNVPLVVFPCRASLHSLIFRRVHMHHSLHYISTNYIPDGRLKLLTIVIIGLGLITGILIPNIELVLVLVGSTTGTVICIIFPSIMFIKVTSKQTTERLLAQAIFFMGVITMIVSTYATLYAAEQAQSQSQQSQAQSEETIPDQNQIRVTEILKEIKHELNKASFVDTVVENKIAKNHNELVANLQNVQNQQEEPKIEKEFSKAPQPSKSPSAASGDDKNLNVIQVQDKEKIKMQDNSNSNPEVRKNEPLELEQQKIPKLQKEEEKPSGNSDTEVEVKAPKSSDKILDVAEAKNQDDGEKEGKKSQPSETKNMEENLSNQNQKQGDDFERIEKIEKKEPLAKESKADDIDSKSPSPDKDAAENFLKTLKEHEENQKKLLEEQRQIIAELKEHHEQDVQMQRQNQKPDINTNQNIQNQNIQEKIPPIPIETEPKIQIQQEETLIDKLSENIEKGKENAEIIEKIEEGLHQEIDKMKEKESKVKLPEPQPPKLDLEQPIILGDKIGSMLKDMKAAQSPQAKERKIQVQDPLILIAQQKSVLRDIKEKIKIDNEKEKLIQKFQLQCHNCQNKKIRGISIKIIKIKISR